MTRALRPAAGRSETLPTVRPVARRSQRPRRAPLTTRRPGHRTRRRVRPRPSGRGRRSRPAPHAAGRTCWPATAPRRRSPARGLRRFRASPGRSRRPMTTRIRMVTRAAAGAGRPASGRPGTRSARLPGTSGRRCCRHRRPARPAVPSRCRRGAPASSRQRQDGRPHRRPSRGIAVSSRSRRRRPAMCRRIPSTSAGRPGRPSRRQQPSHPDRTSPCPGGGSPRPPPATARHRDRRRPARRTSRASSSRASTCPGSRPRRTHPAARRTNRRPIIPPDPVTRWGPGTPRDPVTR
jgi:hypothetical protein